MTHTPGPWEIVDESNDCEIEIVAGPYYNGEPEAYIADVFGGLSSHLANARLIAAAPELLAAAKAVLEHVEDMDIERVGGQCTLCFTYRKLLRDAIAKAEGTGQ